MHPKLLTMVEEVSVAETKHKRVFDHCAVHTLVCIERKSTTIKLFKRRVRGFRPEFLFIHFYYNLEQKRLQKICETFT